jgi:uncharacterized protein YdhG (YjbR/CyaY superfamily)
MINKYISIDDYISGQQENLQANLHLIRKTVRETVHEAIESISYQMPAFKYHGMLCFFAVFKNHYSLFVSPPVRAAFSRELSGFRTTKSAIHFPLDMPLPLDLIREIIRFAAITNIEKAKTKKAKK